MLFRSLLFIFVIVVAKPVYALTVLTTIKPIQMITYELTEGITTPDVLLSSTASPHDYALKPSDVRKINDADVLVWFGEGLEPFLTQLIKKKNTSKVITLSELPGVSYHQFGEKHKDDGHNHGTINPHFWLGPDVAKQVAVALVKQLKNLDTANATVYDQNLDRFLSNVDQMDSRLETTLLPLKGKPYFVFHDAYEYFETYFHLNNLGHFTVSPDRKPGAKTLVRIRSTLNQYHDVCIFAEPQFTPSIIESVTRGTDAKVGHLDPLGVDIPVQKGSYFYFITQIASQFAQCLK